MNNPLHFPAITRKQLDTLQVNLTLKCNQACVHCHVDAGPKRTEAMSEKVIDQVITVLKKNKIKNLDITGGAPELHSKFRYLVKKAASSGVHVIDRCNLTILLEPGYEDLAEFLAAHEVEIVASLPCYSKQNVDNQRGKGVFEKSIRALQKLNSLGYGKEQGNKQLSLVYNPQQAVLPPSQHVLEQDYKIRLKQDFGIDFNQLFVLCNMPINRFGKYLHDQGCYSQYIGLLKESYDKNNLDNVMCRNLISIDWNGYVYDCDFNQMLNMKIEQGEKFLHISDLIDIDINGKYIRVAEHCFACTAGQGSSCGGALQSA